MSAYLITAVCRRFYLHLCTISKILPLTVVLVKPKVTRIIIPKNMMKNVAEHLYLELLSVCIMLFCDVESF